MPPSSSRLSPRTARPNVRRVALAISLAAIAGCGQPPREAEPRRPPEEAVARHEVIVIGDIDPDTPARRISHLQPLADHLAERLADQGIRRGEVVIARSIELVTRVAPALGNVRVDPGQFEQVLMNLVVNAREAMPDGGRLTIETTNIDLDLDGTQGRALDRIAFLAKPFAPHDLLRRVRELSVGRPG